MRHFITLGLFALGMLLAMPALGASQWATCGYATVALAAASNTSSANGKITREESECFYFNSTEDSRVFRVTADTALICLDPDVASEGAANAEVMVRYCHAGATTADVNVCIEVLDAALDGTVGASVTQNACVRVTGGSYYIENSVDAAADEAVVSIQGE
jgi:hypothetical protein